MTGLVCTPSIVPGPAANTQAAIVNDGFLPDIEPDTVKADVRVRDTVTPARLRAAVVAAILKIAPDLVAFVAEQKAAGFTRLEDVPGPTLDGKKVSVQLYERAVGAFAKAELIERNRDVDQTAGGQRDSADLDPAIGELCRDARHAIRDLLGRTRTTVELI